MKNRMAREGESDAWWVARRNGQMLNPQMWSLNLFRVFLAGLWRKQKKVLKQAAKEELSEWGEQMQLQKTWYWEGKLAVPTTQCCNGGTTKSSISQNLKRARETTNRTSKKRMRDGQRKRRRWLLKCVSALV